MVAMKQQGGADADRQAADRRDQRLLAVRQRVEEIDGRSAAIRRLRPRSETRQCRRRRRRRRRACQHDAADRVIPGGSANAAVISAYIGWVSAFFFSGRLIRMTRTPASSATKTCSGMCSL